MPIKPIARSKVKTRCPRCGEGDPGKFSWCVTVRPRIGAPIVATYHSSEMRVIVHLECDTCSETIKHHNADELIEILNGRMDL